MTLPLIDTVRRPGRTMSIRVLPDGRLRLNVPIGASRRKVKKFIDGRTDWIQRQQSELEELYDFSPRCMLAPGLVVEAVESDSLKAEADGSRIVIYKSATHSNWQAYQAARALIKNKLNQLAKAGLPARFELHAAKHGLEYSSLSVRFLRSRWGSCTSAGKITLNSQLLRLPDSLIDYVILHELAHLRVSNHSKKFYQQMENMLPQAKQLRDELKRYRLLH